MDWPNSAPIAPIRRVAENKVQYTRVPSSFSFFLHNNNNNNNITIIIIIIIIIK